MGLRKGCAVLLFSTVALACGKSHKDPPYQPPPIDPNYVPPPTPPSLHFVIDKIYEHEQPTPTGHAPGGDWTFFDAHLLIGGRFVFGRFDGTAAANYQDTMIELAVPNADEGARVVASFAAASEIPVPAARVRGPLTFPTLQNRQQGNMGRIGSGGPYVEFAGQTAYLSYTFDLDGKSGGFSMQYPEVGIQWLVEHLRDGPRTKRTPATDSHLAANAPQVRSWTPIAMGATILAFSPDSHSAFYRVKSANDQVRIMTVPLDDLTNTKEWKGDLPAVSAREYSPDGKRRATCHNGNTVIIADVAAGTEKTFPIHADDQYWFNHTCPTWLDNRYLRFDTSRPGVLDADTMMQSYLDFSDGDKPCVYSADFTVVGCVDQFGKMQ